MANTGSDSVSRIDPATNEVTATIPVGIEPSRVTADRGVVWVTNYHYVFGRLSRIDPATNQVTASIQDGISAPSAVAAGQGAVWVANKDSGSVSRIDY